MKGHLFRELRVGVVLVALATMGLSACGGGGGGSSRTIQVDNRSDDFAGSFLGYYPRDVTVKPGMTLKFHQTWTGEPHSISTGTLPTNGIKPVIALLRGIQAGTKKDPGQPPPEYPQDLFENKLPTLFGQSAGLDQDAAHPCYINTEAELPLDNKACTAAQQKPVPFNGRQAYYSSGFIPFQGSLANSYELKIADDATPGTYFYYCNVHGVLMSGEITIKKDAKVESQASMNRRGQAEADHISKPLLKALTKERAGKGQFKGNLAGSGDHTTDSVQGIANEFTPHTIQAKVGEKVTWTFISGHTISFNVPPYTPIFKFDKDGNLGFNDALNKPAGGWPGAPAGHNSGHSNGPPPPAISVDAGNFDGSGGLKSTGTDFNTGDKYSVTFTKKGTYPYACLIHPGMIGKVVVK